MRLRLILLLLLLPYLLFSQFEAIKSKRNISYANDIDDPQLQKFQKLDIYYPKDTATQHGVLVFIYGGRWYFGDKLNYYLLGRNFAKRGITTVVINYRPVPFVNLREQILDCAKAIAWTSKNIQNYGGNPSKIVVGGHSSGGHIAALLASDSSYFNTLGIANPLKACIQLDGAALDMNCYLSSSDYDDTQHQKNVLVFGDDLSKWATYNPLSYAEKIKIPFLFLMAEKTYPGLKDSYRLFQNKMSAQHLPYSTSFIPFQGHVTLIYTMILWPQYYVTTTISDYIKNLAPL